MSLMPTNAHNLTNSSWAVRGLKLKSALTSPSKCQLLLCDDDGHSCKGLARSSNRRRSPFCSKWVLTPDTGFSTSQNPSYKEIHPVPRVGGLDPQSLTSAQHAKMPRSRASVNNCSFVARELQCPNDHYDTYRTLPKMQHHSGASAARSKQPYHDAASMIPSPDYGNRYERCCHKGKLRNPELP